MTNAAHRTALLARYIDDTEDTLTVHRAVDRFAELAVRVSCVALLVAIVTFVYYCCTRTVA